MEENMNINIANIAEAPKETTKIPVRFIRCTEEDIRKMSSKSSKEQDENSTEEQLEKSVEEQEEN